MKAEIEILEQKMGGSKLITANVGDQFRTPTEEYYLFDNCRQVSFFRVRGSFFFTLFPKVPLPEFMKRFFPNAAKKDGPDARNRQVDGLFVVFVFKCSASESDVYSQSVVQCVR